MIGILESQYDRKTGECIGRRIVETLDMTEDDYYAPLIKIEGECILNKMNEIKTTISQ